jgi:hypothetical protein
MIDGDTDSHSILVILLLVLVILTNSNINSLSDNDIYSNSLTDIDTRGSDSQWCIEGYARVYERTHFFPTCSLCLI